ncbi:hypothetical protein AVEN_148624-1 [Araneus ventricosus]|uniref:Uncharacterized protein n=1 Tax=Araneus ventricosus TaxID=182803 RepID=A0A4Y2UV87_ARAVE|nr:hypothetical protein AVEN_148624-1 [Araneus ventricosus]
MSGSCIQLIFGWHLLHTFLRALSVVSICFHREVVSRWKYVEDEKRYEDEKLPSKQSFSSVSFDDILAVEWLLNATIADKWDMTSWAGCMYAKA